MEIVRIPKTDTTNSEFLVIKWLKKSGQRVKARHPLVEVQGTITLFGGNVRVHGYATCGFLEQGTAPPSHITVRESCRNLGGCIHLFAAVYLFVESEARDVPSLAESTCPILL